MTRLEGNNVVTRVVRKQSNRTYFAHRVDPRSLSAVGSSQGLFTIGLKGVAFVLEGGVLPIRAKFVLGICFNSSTTCISEIMNTVHA